MYRTWLRRTLFIKNNIDTTLKDYILLFICASPRPRHLELTPEMKALVFIIAFEGFIAYTGTPKDLINDSFKTFKSSIVKNLMLYLGVRQKFVLPVWLWWDGLYEQLVRWVKMSLKKDSWKIIVKLWRTSYCFAQNRISNKWTPISIPQWRWFRWVTYT